MDADRHIEPSGTEWSDLDLEPSDDAYGRAMVRGTLIGWVVLPLVTLLITSLGAPDWSWKARIAISLMVGFWVGLFFGGAASVAILARGYEKRDEEVRTRRIAAAVGDAETEATPKVPATAGTTSSSGAGGDIAA